VELGGAASPIATSRASGTTALALLALRMAAERLVTGGTDGVVLFFEVGIVISSGAGV
jgi:hypothetical protein